MTKQPIKLNLELIFLISLTIFSFYISLVNINFPTHKIFDEVYQITRTELFLHDKPFFSPQPHFGRYLKILGILLCGDNSVGWRITQAITSSILIPVMYLIGKKIFNHKYAGLLAAFLTVFELSYLAYSRVGVMIIHLVFFSALSLLLFILATESNSKNSKLFFYLSAITTGLSIATKWTALILLPIFFLWTTTNLKNKLYGNLSFKTLFLVIVASTYLLTFAGEKDNFEYLHQVYKMPNSNFAEGIISWHKLVFAIHANTHNHHPCASKWYTWPFMYRPVLLYWEFNGVHKQITTILGFGNPVIWWLGILAILFQLFMLFFKRDKTIIFLLGSYFISFLPYAFITRIMFLYHYLPSLLFVILILEYTFVSLYNKKNEDLRFLLMLSIVLVVSAFFYFYPFVNGYPVSMEKYTNRLWFKSWRVF